MAAQPAIKLYTAKPKEFMPKKRPKKFASDLTALSDFAVFQLTRSAPLLLLMYLVRNASKRGIVRVGHEKIMEDLGLSSSSVDRALAVLRKGKWLTGRRTTKTNEYDVSKAFPHVQPQTLYVAPHNGATGCTDSGATVILDFPSGCTESGATYSTLVPLIVTEAQSGLTSHCHDDPLFIPDTER